MLNNSAEILGQDVLSVQVPNENTQLAASIANAAPPSALAEHWKEAA
jgi:hypothetical protein